MPGAAVSDPLMRSDEKPLAEYRSVSKLAVAAALFGVASALVLVGPLLVPVALVAIVFSVMALRAIAASEGQLVGRLPAIVGLSLAVLFLGWGGSRYVARQTQLEMHAQAFCESWLALMAQGQYRQADQLRMPSPQRVFSEEALEEYYAGDYEAADRLEALVSQPPMDDFIAEGKDVRYRFEGLANTRSYGRTDYVVLQYTMERSAERGGPRSFWIQVQRIASPVAGQPPEWMFSSVMHKDPGS